MANCEVISISGTAYAELLQKHKGNKKAALDEYVSSKASVVKAEVVDLDSTILPHASNVTKGFSVAEEAYATNLVTNMVAQTINNIQNITEEQAASQTHPVLKDYYTRALKINSSTLQDVKSKTVDSIKDLSIAFYKINVGRKLKQLTDEHKAFNSKVIAEIRKEDSVLWNKIRNNLKLQYGYIVSEETDFIDEANEMSANWNENAQFKINPNDKLSAEIKLHINSTADINPDAYTINEDGIKVYQQKVDNFGGLPKTLNYKDVVPHLMDYLPEATSVQDMMDKLDHIVKAKYPALQSLRNRLGKSEILRNLMFANFYKPAPMRVSNKVSTVRGKLTVTTNFHNKSGYSVYKLADRWVQNLTANLLQGKYSAKFMNGQTELSIEFTETILGSIDRNLKVSKVNELFNNLGIDTTNEGINDIIDNKDNREYVDVPSNVVIRMRKDPRYSKLNFTDQQLIDLYVDNQVINENLITPIKYIYDYINTYNAERTEEVAPIVDFDQYGTILKLANQFRLYNAPISNNSFINVNGEREFSNTNPAFIDDFFTLRNDKKAFTKRLRQFALEPSFNFSNWLFGTHGLLNIPQSLVNDDGTFNITEDTVNQLTLNEVNYTNFDYKFYAGVVNTTSKVGNDYIALSSNDWDLVQAEVFNTGGIESKTFDNQAGYFIPVPSDRGNTRIINAYKYLLTTSNYKGGKLNKNSSFYKAIKNTVYQEFARMTQAAKLVDEVIETSSDELANKLLNGYHYETNKDGEKIFKDTAYNYVGSVFNFYNTNFISESGDVTSLNDVLTVHDILNVDNPYLNKDINSKVEEHLDAFIANMISEEVAMYRPNNDFIRANVNSNVKSAIAEQALNYYLANVEMVNMFMGAAPFYGNTKKSSNAMNKRATQLLASGNGNAAFGSDKSFNALTVTEATKSISAIRKDIKRTLKANGLSTKDAERITEAYDNIDTGDGQSYITLDEFERRLKIQGTHSKYKELLKKLRSPEVLTPEDVTNFIQLQKNFYYGYEYDADLNMNIPVQIKNSEFVLIPKFIKGSQLEVLNNIMTRNKVDQLNFDSAQKIGHRNIVKLLDEKLDIQDGGIPLDIIIKQSTVQLKYQNLKKQQDIANHIVDTKNKLGTQIARAIITNIDNPALIKEYFDLLKFNIEGDSNKLLSDMGISETDGVYDIDHSKLIKFIESEVIDRDLNNNFVEGIKLNDRNEPNIPLDFNIQRRKYISILTSLFSNRVVNQKFPGVHGPQLSNAFMTRLKDKGVAAQTDAMVDFRKLKYQHHKAGRFHHAEVLMPAWSKDFFKEGGKVTIADLQAAGLNTMIGYRIPTEDKHSTFVFDIVGFLDDSQGSTIVVPDEFVAQTGSDFDIDSVYSMMYNHRKDKDGNLVKYAYHDNNETIWDMHYQPTINFLGDLDNIISKEYDEGLISDDSPEAKLLDDILGLMPDIFTDTEIDAILKEKNYSLDIYNNVVERIKAFPSKEEFMQRPVAQNNTRKGRENRILDMYIDILSDESNYEEMATASSFDDTTNATKESNEASGGIFEITNYNTRIGQRIYRERVLAGKELKALSVNRDGLNAIAQIAGMRIYNSEAIKIKYDIKLYPLKKLRKVFGKENVTNDGEITHTYIANDAEGTGRNVLGRLITSYSAQSTAHILDNVKFPLPKGVNSYTFKVWKTFADVGATWEYATKFIDQPIVMAVSKYQAASKSAYNAGSKRIFELAKSEYQVELVKLLAKNDQSSIAKKLLYQANTYGRVMISKKNMKEAYKFLGYETGIQTAFAESELTGLLEYGNPTKLNTLSDAGKIKYYKAQLKVLENFILYDNVAKELGTVNAVTSFDKASVGPTFENTTNRIDKIHELHGKGKYIHINDKSVVSQLYPKYLTSVYNNDIYDEELHIEPNTVSKYAVLEDYLQHGFLNAINSLSGEFINFSAGFRKLDSIVRNSYDTNVMDKLHTYTIAYGLRYLPFFNNEVDARNRLLGINYKSVDPVDISVINKESVELFKSKPLAIKLAVIKDQYKDLIDDSSILNAITPVFDKEFVKTNGHYGMKFDANADDNTMIESFSNLWYNSNPYLHLLAQDIVKYAYFVNGLSFGFNNISKVIPSQILYSKPNSLGTEHGVEILEGIGAVDEFEKFKVLNTIPEFASLNYDNIFAINFGRANGRNSSIVPLANTKWERDAMNPNIMAVAEGTPNWFLNNKGYITMNDKQYRSLPFDIKSAAVLNVNYHKGSRETSGYGLFAYHSEYVGHNEHEHYFFPVTQLAPNEFTNMSYNAANNVAIDESADKTIQEFIQEVSTRELSRTGEAIYLSNVENPLSLEEQLELSTKGSITINRSSSFAEDFKVEDGKSAITEINNVELLISNIGYNEINQDGARRWQYVVSRAPSGDVTLKASVIEDSNIDTSNKRIEYIKGRIIAYGKRGQVFKNHELLKNTYKSLSGIDFTDAEHHNQALALQIDYNYSYRTIESLKRKLYETGGFDTEGYFSDMATNREKQKDFTEFFSYATVFLKGFNHIKNLSTIRKEKLTDGEKEINKAIRSLKELGYDIDELTATVNHLRERYFDEVLSPLSTNPDIKNELRKLFDISDDESKAQLFLDALADTNNPFVANFVKNFILVLGRAKNESVAKQREFKSKINKFTAQGLTIKSLLEVDENGNTTNQFIREFDEQYKQDLSDFNDKLENILATKGKYSKEYYKVEKEFNEWKFKNLEQEDLHDVVRANLDTHDILNKNIAARKALDAIKDKEYEINSKYTTIVSAGDISDIDLAELADLKFQRKELASPFKGNVKKTGVELSIANTIQEYNKSMAETINKFKDSKVDDMFKNELDKHLKSDSKESKEWIDSNTITKNTDEFYEELNKAFTALGKGEIDTNKSAILAPYRDEDGIIDGTAVPSNVAAELKAKEEEKYQEVDVDGNKTTGILKPFKSIRNIVSTESYQHIMDDKGNSTNDDKRNDIINEMNNILSEYSVEDGTDYSAISLEDLQTLTDFKLELDILTGLNVIDADRADWQSWYGDNHKSIVNEAAFRASETIAKSKGDDYYNAWKDFNTTLTIDEKYYDLIKNIADDIFGDTQKAHSEHVISIDKLKGESLRRSAGSKDSFSELTNDEKIRISDKSKSLLSPVGNNSLTSLLNDGVNVINAINGIPVATVEKYDSLDNLQAAAKKLHANKKLTPKVKYLDQVAAISKVENTDAYTRISEERKDDKQWYNDNHTLDINGNVIPLAMWMNVVPSDNKLYNKEGIDKRFWATSELTSDRYIDKTKTTAKTWMNSNIRFSTTEYYDRAKVANEGNQEWFDNNHTVNPYTGQFEPISIWKTMKAINDKHINEHAPDRMWTNLKTKKEFINKDYRSVHGYALPTTDSKYYNKKYDNIKDNSLYKYLKGMLHDLVQHVPNDTIIANDELPIGYKASKDTLKSRAKGIARSIGWYDNFTPTIVGENDEVIRFLKLPFLNSINSEELIPEIERTEGMSDLEFANLRAERKAQNVEIKKRNKLHQAANLDTNFEDIINTFIKTTTEHKYKSEFEPEVKLALEQAKQLKLSRRESSTGRLTDKLATKFKPKGLETADDEMATSIGEGSNVEKHLERFIKMVFYNEFEANEGNVAKVARVLQNFTSAKGMWLNMPGAFNNVAYGKTQIAMERFSGYYFNNSHRNTAEISYWKVAHDLLASDTSSRSKSLDAALIREMDILELQAEQAITGNVEIDKLLSKKLISTNTMYALHHMGEHYMQNATLLAMLHSNKIVNGKAQGWAEYSFDIRHDAFKVSISKKEQVKFDAFISENKNKDRYRSGQADLLRDYILKSDTKIQQSFLQNLDKLAETKKKEFNSLPTLYDQYDLVDGYAKLKPNAGISEDQVILFNRKVVSVNQKIHGIYNKLDANTIQHYAVGRMGMQFRKWMRPGWNKRFGSKFGKKYWNESRNDYEQGAYIAFGRFVAKPILDNLNKDAISNDEFTAKQAFKNIINDYVNYSKNVKLYWNTLDNSDKANVKRTLTELAYLAGMMIAGVMLRGLSDEYPILQDSKNYAYALYLQDRLQSELRTYDPLFGWFNESKKLISSPFATTNTIEELLSLSYTALFEGDTEYKGGIYSKESKLKVKSFKMIPLVNRALRYSNIEDYAGYFKLYSY